MRKVFKHVKTLSERSKRVKEQKKKKGSVLAAELAYKSHKTQFGLVMNEEKVKKNAKKNHKLFNWR